MIAYLDSHTVKAATRSGLKIRNDDTKSETEEVKNIKMVVKQSV